MTWLWFTTVVAGLVVQLIARIVQHAHHHDPQGLWSWVQVMGVALEGVGIAVMAWANLDARAKAQRAAAKP